MIDKLKIDKLIVFLEDKLKNGDVKLNIDNLMAVLDEDLVNKNLYWVTKELKENLEPKGYYVRYDPMIFTFDRLESSLKYKRENESTCEQEKRERRIEKVLNYLKIDDYDGIDDESFDEYLYIVDDFDNGENHIHDICKLIVDKQNEIFQKSGVLIPSDELIKRLIVRGLRACKI